MDDMRVTAEQIAGTKERLQELRELMGNDEAVYDELCSGLDPENALAFHAASELTGIHTYDKNNELGYWDRVSEIENDAFGLDRSTEQYKKYQTDFWRLAIDKMENTITIGLDPEHWKQLDMDIRELIISVNRVNEYANIGKISYYDSNETLIFTDREAYLDALREAFDVLGINGWSYQTVATDVDTCYQVACLTRGEYGKDINKEAFYRLHEQHGPDMRLWGDASQWIVQDEYYFLEPAEERESPAEDTIPRLSLDDRLAAAVKNCAQQNHDRPAPRHDRGMER